MSEYREIRGSLQGERCEHKSWTDLCERCEIGRLRKALQDIKELPGEINPDNYDHDDVVLLNNSFCKAFEIACTALGEEQ